MEVAGLLHAPAAIPKGKIRVVQEPGWAADPVCELWMEIPCSYRESITDLSVAQIAT
jgi:hypothetical protein